MKKILMILIAFALIGGVAYAADTEVQDLAAIASPAVGDVLYVVDDPGGTPASKKITIGDALGVAAALDSTGALVANSVDSDAYVDGSIDLAHMSAESVDSDQYVDGSIDAVHLADLGGDVMSGMERHIRATVIDPNAVYAIDTQICLVVSLDAAITITNIEITCDADPTTELDLDLKWADAFIGLANAAVIDVCDTTSGATSISSGFDDADVASGKCVYLQFGAEPDANMTQFSVDITYDYD